MMKKVLLGFLLLISVTFLFVNIKNRKDEIVDSENLAVYINNELTNSIPEKGEAIYIKSVCDNNAKATWDNDNWGLLVTNMSKKTRCNLYFYEGQTVFNFDYTGSEQVFTVPVSGTYKLETWGAQGGDSNTALTNIRGGVGGFSSGNLILTKNENLYINIGGKGLNISQIKLLAGGYNGGGSGGVTEKTKYFQGGASGGGATHIATKSGLLETLENYKIDILIVSGGGGATFFSSEADSGSSGGGYKGNNGSFSGDWPSMFGIGGSQIKGGYDNSSKKNDASFGKGSDLNEEGYGGNGGGGGYYGGGGTNRSHSGAGGGSGYIGNSLLKDKVMYCYNCEESNEESTKTISTTCSEETPTENCAKKGNGYARITLISIDE